MNHMTPWLVKTREMHNHHFDSTIWHEFDFRHDDIVIGVPLGGIFWDGGAQTFVHKDINGRWREVLTADESEKYERLAQQNLGGECARWLATGNLG